jgi:hypothetical protein
MLIRSENDNADAITVDAAKVKYVVAILRVETFS